MADDDAESLRKQIAFLSGLIKSHKSESKNGEESQLITQVDSKNLRQNKSWSRWQKPPDLLIRDGFQSIHVKNVTHQGSFTGQSSHTASKAGLTFQKVNTNKISDKFTYRGNCLQAFNVTGGTRIQNSCNISMNGSNNRWVVAPRKQGTASVTCGSIHLSPSKVVPVFVYQSIPQSFMQNSKQSMNKVLRNQVATKWIPSNHGVQNLSANVNLVKRSPTTSAHLPKQMSSTCLTKSRQADNNFQWLKKRKGFSTQTSSSTSKVLKNNQQSVPVPAALRGSKLKWRRKSQTQTCSQVKTRPAVNMKQLHTATKISKMKWRRKSVTGSDSQPLKMTRTAGRSLQLQTIPKSSKMKWRRKSASQLNISSGRKTKLGRRKQSSRHIVHKSQYSFKKVDADLVRMGRPVTGALKTSHAWHGVRSAHLKPGKSGLQNWSFVARRARYVTHSSYLPNKHHLVRHFSSLCSKAGSRKTVAIGGINYTVGSHGRTLKRSTISTAASVASWQRKSDRVVASRNETKPLLDKVVNRTLKRQHSFEKYRNERANKILKRTIQTVQASIKKDNRRKLKSQQYCMFFSKFGKCSKQKQGMCPYIHDPTKIAVCTRFLRGKCDKMDGTCPFSHKIEKEKMPICQYFLKGKCTRDDCPYSHVNVGRSAEVCEDFLKGYCALGFKCKKKHVLECEEFTMTGHCPNGSRCKLIHRKKLRQPDRYFQEVTSAKEQVPPAKKKRLSISDGFLPLEDSTLDDTEEIKQSTEVVCHEQDKTSSTTLQIRPKFTRETNSDGFSLSQSEASSDG